ncbi:ribonuclease P protein component [Pseudooceanicola antarcticus]|uniref:Ribonuclease P protein component n=2 Tax=Pseudooceanicola antarcticus TaxID=1247613 RepID=A0ABX4MSI1_9RHOB|nr:ribonuclease P protein component [Pseudooceanicola antarcticus]PJE31755.1 ribonuclease P protein component [Pseudooceanicola antarcticus]
MTPPTVPPASADKATGARTSAVSSCPDTPLPKLTILSKRSEFLAAARARRQPGGSLMLQARRRAETEPVEPAQIRVGFTCSKKVGNAVARNRAKRRLREAARAVLPRLGHPGWDYVLIGRHESTAARPFELLIADLEKAVTRLHEDRVPKPPREAGAKSPAKAQP